MLVTRSLPGSFSGQVAESQSDLGSDVPGYGNVGAKVNTFAYTPQVVVAVAPEAPLALAMKPKVIDPFAGIFPL